MSFYEILKWGLYLTAAGFLYLAGCNYLDNLDHPGWYDWRPPAIAAGVVLMALGLLIIFTQ